MRSIEVEAKTIEDAQELACSKLECEPDKLEVEILSESKGMFGLGRKIRIRASVPGSEPGTPDDRATPDWAMDPSFDPRLALEKVCQMIDSSATVTASERDGRRLLNIVGDGSGIFIGRKGQTLDAFQFIINKMNLKQTGRPEHILVDSEGYTQRRIAGIHERAETLGEKVRQNHRPMTTEPMSAHDRRIVHTTFHNDSELTTRSIGDGEYKRVRISLKNEGRGSY
jgi:spoIIIJ-associated protein